MGDVLLAKIPNAVHGHPKGDASMPLNPLSIHHQMMIIGCLD